MDSRTRRLSHRELPRPVPETLAGARVLTTAEAEAIWRAKSGVFIDVLPRAPKPKDLPAGTVWRDKPRRTFPAASGCLTPATGPWRPATEDYLRQGLARASGGNKQAAAGDLLPSDCWMSWNAAKRTLAYGYTNVAWYPEGTDGWEHANLPLAEAQPELAAGRGEMIAAPPSRVRHCFCSLVIVFASSPVEKVTRSPA